MIYCITQHQINKQVKDWPFTQKAKTYVRHRHISTLTLLSNYVRKLCRSKFRCKSILINASQFLAKIMKILHFTVAYECHKTVQNTSKIVICMSIVTPYSYCWRWRSLEDVFRLHLQKTSSRPLDQDEYVRQNFAWHHFYRT